MHVFERSSEPRQAPIWISLSTAARLWAAVCLAGCFASNEVLERPPIDVSVDESFDSLEITDDELRGVLALINAPDTTLEVLESLVAGLAAEGLTEERPISSRAQLDAAPYVGLAAWNALEHEACDVRGLCEPTIDLLSWNVENFPNSGRTVPAVRGLLEDLAPTVVGFQEILDRVAFRELMDSLPNYEGFAGEQRGRDTAVAFAFRSDRVFIDQVRSLFVEDSYAFPRSPMALTFSMTGRAGYGLFTVVVVHLKARGDEESEARRRDAMQKLDVWVAEHSETVTPNVFVVGDFNDHLSDVPEDDVFVPFRNDAYVILTQSLADAGEYSYIPERYRGLIDHMVSTDDAEVNFPPVFIEAVAAEVTIEDYVEGVSDHRPMRSRHIPILPVWR